MTTDIDTPTVGRTTPIEAVDTASHAATYRGTRWWLRIVGSLYLLMATANFVGMYTGDQSMVRDNIPFPADDAVVHAFIDGWQTFVLALTTLGIMAWYASTRPARSGMLVATICLGELLFGIAGDATLIARGYSASAYVPFIAFHLALIGTGVWVISRDRLLAD